MVVSLLPCRRQKPRESRGLAGDLSLKDGHMVVEQFPALREVDENQFVDRFKRAYLALKHAELGDAEDRWAGAAEDICGLLGFTLNEEALWTGLHEAADALASAQDELREVQERFSEFLDAEYVLLTRRGLSSGAAGEIVANVRLGLMSFDSPTHSEIDETRGALTTLADSLCSGVRDWSAFAEPERRARRHVNTIVALSATGGLVATASNAAAVIFLPFIVGSIAGGLAAGVGALLGFQRRRR
jgi:hypothetical protein